MIATLVGVLQAAQIEEKIKNAPDQGYEIGVVIGTYLPFVILVIFAYIIYNAAKNRKDLND